jgi:hypothetical protein
MKKKSTGFFANHAKSSAAIISLGIHVALIFLAVTFVAVTVIHKSDQRFDAKPVSRPRMELKKLQVPVNIKKNTQKPKLRKRIVVNKVRRSIPDIQLPEISGVKGAAGIAEGDFGGLSGIGFSMPELNFLGAKAEGEKIVFVVHFGPATISESGEESQGTPFSRMTGLTIRNRLEDLVDSLPQYALFNVISYFAGDAWAMEPKLQLATPENKQKLKEWMSSVNPLEGDYHHCFAGKPSSINKAYQNYPTRVDNLPFYATKWAYPYYVPDDLEQKYTPDAPNGIIHWGRGVAWAILEQKADTIFVLTTNYIDGWRVTEEESGEKIEIKPYQPRKMASALRNMCVDVYGLDKSKWPTINVVVLAKAGRDIKAASRTLSEYFAPIIGSFDSDGSIIEDIKKYMNEEERELYFKYQSEYGNR